MRQVRGISLREEPIEAREERRARTLRKEQAMQEDQRRAAKGRLIALMQAGHPWHEAAAMAGVHIGFVPDFVFLFNMDE